MTTIGLIGGTGEIGTALAVHLTRKYDVVFLGSRSKERAEKTVSEILSEKEEREDIKNHLRPETNERVVALSEDLILTVPPNAAIDTIKELNASFRKGQLLVSAVAAIRKTGNEFVPLKKDNVSSISKTVQDLLPEIKVATAFQSVPAKVLYDEKPIEADVFVSCNESSTYLRTASIITTISGLRPLYAGSLELSSEIEGLTALLLNVSISAHIKRPTLKVLSF